MANKYRMRLGIVEAMQVPVFEEGLTEEFYKAEFAKVEDWVGTQANWSRVRPISLPVGEGLVASPGDWVVKLENGDWTIYSDADFTRGYEAIARASAVDPTAPGAGAATGDPYLYESGT